jgi:hypothetical protein
MGHGGKRKGAGRKSNVDIARAREMFRSVIPDARRRKMIEHLAKLAEDDQARPALEALRLLAPYLFGVPTEKNSVEEPEKEISVIRIIDPGEKRRVPNDESDVSD